MRSKTVRFYYTVPHLGTILHCVAKVCPPEVIKSADGEEEREDAFVDTMEITKTTGLEVPYLSLWQVFVPEEKPELLWFDGSAYVDIPKIIRHRMQNSMLVASGIPAPMLSNAGFYHYMYGKVYAFRALKDILDEMAISKAGY